MAMGVVSACSWLSFCLALFLLLFPSLLHSLPHSNGNAFTYSSWTISPGGPGLTTFQDGSQLRIIIFGECKLADFIGPVFASGFYCVRDSNSFVFGVFIIYANVEKGNVTHCNSEIIPQMVWSANRNNLVTMNASLEVTSTNGLVLSDANRTVVWSTTNAGRSVAGLNLTRDGNLVVVGEDGLTLWESFNHPTDSLLPGQYLKVGQNLISSVSATNRSEGLFSLSLTDRGLLASVRSKPPEFYLYFGTDNPDCGYSFLVYNNTNATMKLVGTAADCIRWISLPSMDFAAPFIRFESDGHLRLYNFVWIQRTWSVAADVFRTFYSDCDYPMACGRNGICRNGKCVCPKLINGTSFFEQESMANPFVGCSAVTPLSCEAYALQTFIELENTSYFTFDSGFNNSSMDIVDSFDLRSGMVKNHYENCKQACLRNCSCKASFIVNDGNSTGFCYLRSEILSLKYRATAFAFLKVQNVAPQQNITPKKESQIPRILATCVEAILGFLLLFGFLFLLFRRKRDVEELEEDCLDQIPGMLVRFSYKDLVLVTMNFACKIGEGGFGTVFEGTLSDETKVAVKCLDGLECKKKSFVAEVETIGSIHHVNLVRLIGFCAEKSHRLLVYEFMSNGSLDKWIFKKSMELRLDWLHRKKIILDIAKGLAYLHEGCQKKVIHMDIKPENILLDSSLNAKVADFGLAKLIDREQSQVLTTARGTFGYLAPECFCSGITEKIDVYSFGIVVLEILCGRKNLDHSLPEDETHLLAIFKRKYEERQLVDLVDKQSEDMQVHSTEAMHLFHLAAWCLQSDFSKRPSMSVVVNVLESGAELDQKLDPDFLRLPWQCSTIGYVRTEAIIGVDTGVQPSLLSGPR